MHSAQSRGESFVRLPFSKIRNYRSETGAFLKMASGVLVSTGSAVIERKLNHRAQGQSRRQGMFAGEGVGDGRQHLVTIAVQFLCPAKQKFRRTIGRRPGREERQRRGQICEILGVIERSVFDFNVVEIGQPFQIVAQV